MGNVPLKDCDCLCDPTRFVTNAVNGMVATMARLPEVMCDLGMITKEQLAAMSQPQGGEGQAAESAGGQTNGEGQAATGNDVAAESAVATSTT